MKNAIEKFLAELRSIREKELNELKNQKIVAVDLGLTNSAVCSAMTSKGTVLNRKFISLKREKDLLSHALNKNKKH